MQSIEFCERGISSGWMKGEPAEEVCGESIVVVIIVVVVVVVVVDDDDDDDTSGMNLVRGLPSMKNGISSCLV